MHVHLYVQCKIIHSLKRVEYLHVQADKPWCNYYLAHACHKNMRVLHVHVVADTVNPEIFARILFSRIALKDKLAMFKFVTRT